MGHYSFCPIMWKIVMVIEAFTVCVDLYILPFLLHYLDHLPFLPHYLVFAPLSDFATLCQDFWHILHIMGHYGKNPLRNHRNRNTGFSLEMFWGSLLNPIGNSKISPFDSRDRGLILPILWHYYPFCPIISIMGHSPDSVTLFAPLW